MKIYPAIGCCGIDCGLCPRYHTDGSSACPGCGAPDFKDKHPACGYVTCCVTKHGFETCADCPDYPCSRFDAEKKGRDSFVTHRKVFDNLNMVRETGIKPFLDQQTKRINLLKHLLKNFNDGRSKSFFCLACALLPLDNLITLEGVFRNIQGTEDAKERNRLARSVINTLAQECRVELTLRKN